MGLDILHISMDSFPSIQGMYESTVTVIYKQPVYPDAVGICCLDVRFIV